MLLVDKLNSNRGQAFRILRASLRQMPILYGRQSLDSMVCQLPERDLEIDLMKEIVRKKW